MGSGLGGRRWRGVSTVDPVWWEDLAKVEGREAVLVFCEPTRPWEARNLASKAH